MHGQWNGNSEYVPDPAHAPADHSRAEPSQSGEPLGDEDHDQGRQQSTGREKAVPWDGPPGQDVGEEEETGHAVTTEERHVGPPCGRGCDESSRESCLAVSGSVVVSPPATHRQLPGAARGCPLCPGG